MPSLRHDSVAHDIGPTSHLQAYDYYPSRAYSSRPLLSVGSESHLVHIPPNVNQIPASTRSLNIKTSMGMPPLTPDDVRSSPYTSLPRILYSSSTPLLIHPNSLAGNTNDELQRQHQERYSRHPAYIDTIQSPTAGIMPFSDNQRPMSPHGHPFSPASPVMMSPASATLPRQPNSPLSPTIHMSSTIFSSSGKQKVYSFVPAEVNHKKRRRRKYDEVERLYRCEHQCCTKAYGTLNHLNAHISMQNHGSKRHPSEFKELRKMWREQKKERDREDQ